MIIKINIKLILISLLGLLLVSCSTDFVRPTFKSNTDKEKQPVNVTKQAKPIETIKPKKLRPERPKYKISKAVKKYCKLVDSKFRKYGWGKSRCEKYDWHHVRNSYLGRPLIWKSWGTEKNIKEKNVTLIMCGVHGDEITPVKFCFDVIKSMDKLVYDPNSDFDLTDKLVVVAPIVTPDSFFKKYPTRTNYRGVDVNRNFPTKDWKKDALRLWKKRYRSDKRRFPGKKPLSEQSTVFQVNLIKRYNPDKIVSVHAPLTIIDYDGPSKGPKEIHSHVPNQLLIQMSKDASGYRIKNYPFFPGSLGNWAGNERGIPTYTLELPTSDNRKHREHWKLFQKAIYSAINRNMDTPVNIADKDEVTEAKNKL